MYKVAVLKGDGIGPEIMHQCLRVLDVIKKTFKIDVEIKEAHFGGSGIDHEGHPFSNETKAVVDWSDAVLLGAVGGPKWDHHLVRPEQGLLELRKYLDAYCNLRPVMILEALKIMSPLKLKSEQTVDMCFVRELTGGIYFGEKKKMDDKAYDIKAYTRSEIERIAYKAFERAEKRRGKICSIDKSNVLASSKLWRETVDEVSKQSSAILTHMYVDNAAMQLILNPSQFDVILTSNMFGDILSDEASVLSGSIGVLPSASLGDKQGIYEPIHGSAPDIAGEDIANPIGMILSMAMMFENSFDRSDIYHFVVEHVNKVLNLGYGTPDLKQLKTVTTTEWTNHLLRSMSG